MKTFFSIRTFFLLWGCLFILHYGNVRASPITSNKEDTMVFPSGRYVNVRGRGEVSVLTSHAVVHLTIEVVSKQAKQAQKKNAMLLHSVLSVLKKSPIQHLQTEGIQWQPTYSYKDNDTKLTGYKAQNKIGFEVSLDSVGVLLDEVVAIGNIYIDEVQLKATDTVLRKAEEEALRRAVQDAQRQAQVVLDALGLSPKEISQISIEEMPFLSEENLQPALLQASSTSIIGGKKKVKASVILHICY